MGEAGGVGMTGGTILQRERIAGLWGESQEVVGRDFNALKFGYTPPAIHPPALQCVQRMQ
jgi:hypothetical protein